MDGLRIPGFASFAQFDPAVRAPRASRRALRRGAATWQLRILRARPLHRSRARRPPQALLKFNDITPTVQRHLTRTYATLAYGAVVAVAGGAVQQALGGGWHLLWLLGMFGALVWLMATKGDTTSKRLAIFTAFAACQGAALGDFTTALAGAHPSVPLTAGLGTLAVFACFSLFALSSPRRSYLYLGGVLSSAMTALAIVSLSAYFFASSAMFTLQLYAGLQVFIGYVVFDTQLIVQCSCPPRTSAPSSCAAQSSYAGRADGSALRPTAHNTSSHVGASTRPTTNRSLYGVSVLVRVCSRVASCCVAGMTNCVTSRARAAAPAANRRASMVCRNSGVSERTSTRQLGSRRLNAACADASAKSATARASPETASVPVSSAPP